MDHDPARRPGARLDPAGLVLWFDESLLVINKPAGLPSLPEGGDRDAPHVKSLLETEWGRLWTVHRLDKGTSGALLLARSAEAHRALNIQFEERRVTKIYHALVSGEPEWETQRVELPLRAGSGHRRRSVVDWKRGKPAVTGLRLLERFRGCALVEAEPQTGRTHQIRVHLYALGHPLLGDDLYGPGVAGRQAPEQPILKRPGLHAFSLAIYHPMTGAPLRFEALYPPDFAAELACLRKELRGNREES